MITRGVLGVVLGLASAAAFAYRRREDLRFWKVKVRPTGQRDDYLRGRDLRH